jgi:hypothetical protein
VARVTVRATTQGLIAACGGVRAGRATLVAKSFPQNSLIEKQPTQESKLTAVLEWIQQKRD